MQVVRPKEKNGVVAKKQQSIRDMLSREEKPSDQVDHSADSDSHESHESESEQSRDSRGSHDSRSGHRERSKRKTRKRRRKGSNKK